MLIEAQKGKALDKLPKKEAASFDTDIFAVSTKYDGNQIFIVKRNNKVTWFTSDNKQFDIPGLGTELLHNKSDFILVAEFMYNCEGKLGDRKYSAILTTLRTCWNKLIANPLSFKEELCNIKVFDCLPYQNSDLCSFVQYDLPYENRLEVASLLHYPEQISKITYKTFTGDQAKKYSKNLVNLGWEGVMCIDPKSKYQAGKRVNYSVKLKYRKTADLLCIDVVAGELGSKYEYSIGALVLQDSEGRVVSVGSGLDDKDRKPRLADYYIGKIIEIEYEQIMDTYIQPVYVQVRLDKQKAD